MKKINTFLFVILSFAVFAHSPTWTKEIAKIVYKNCSNCHRNGGLAPFSLMSYDDAYNNRFSLNASVSQKSMPPWPPDTKYGSLAHERILTDDEIHLIDEWVTNNAPYGNASEEPAKPVFSSNEVITAPDAVFTIPQITLNTTEDIYVCFPLPSGLTVDKFISGFECIPGNSEAVHHVLVYQDTANTCYTLDNQYPGPGYLSFGGVGTNTAKLIGIWVPGATPTFYPNNMGVRLNKNANIIIQIHYPKGLVNKTDKTKINFKLTTNASTRELFIAPILNHTISLTNGPLIIPANTQKTFNSQFKLQQNASVIGVAPHMHLIGTEIKSFAITAAKDTLKFIQIPNWDFHWQGFYQFKKVMKVPAGTTLYGEAKYDNTTNNPNNPNNPPKLVTLGENTDDEMMLIYFTFAAYQPGDENIVIDSTSTVTSSSNPINKISASIYPNPTSTSLRLEWNTDESKKALVQVFDLYGKLLESSQINMVSGLNYFTQSTDKLTNGNYFIKLTSDDFYIIEKFVVKK